VYGDEFIYDYISIYRAQPGWEKKLDDQNVEMVLIDPSAPLANALRQSLLWEPVFEDANSVIFMRSQSFLAASRTSALCSEGLTFSNTLAIRPCESIKNVVRKTPS